MDKIKIVEKIRKSINHHIYKVAFGDDISDWNFFRESHYVTLKGQWYLSIGNASLYREELLLLESILRGLNSNE